MTANDNRPAPGSKAEAREEAENSNARHKLTRAIAKPPGCWFYDQSTGDLFDENGEWVDKGYSGKLPMGLNNPHQEKFAGIGPVPAGLYYIGLPRTSEKTGPFVLDLTPIGHKAYGRTGLQIHGDNAKGNMSASSGCLIFPRTTRGKIAGGPPLIKVFCPDSYWKQRA